jgi:hypothetical protein
MAGRGRPKKNTVSIQKSCEKLKIPNVRYYAIGHDGSKWEISPSIAGIYESGIKLFGKAFRIARVEKV